MRQQLNHIKSELDHWPEMPARHICSKIIDFVEENPISQLEMLSMRTLAHISNENSIDRDLISAILILSSSLNVIERRFLYFAADKKEYPLSEEDFNEAEKLGTIIDPSTGTEVEVLENNIFIYYTISNKIRLLKNSA